MPKIAPKSLLCITVVVMVPLLWTRLGWFGKMPVGGDATRFGLGLMSELGRAFTEYRIPFWNSLWGYGFPALAESQMGVFYPPHMLLYRFLSLEYAYTFDMALHAVWSALGTWLLARRMGRSELASALAVVAFVTSGFFLVHEPHHWGWTTGSWLPWIFLAGFRLVQDVDQPMACRIRSILRLAFCIAMPVLTGHFQLGFISMVSMGLWCFVLVLIHGRRTCYKSLHTIILLILGPVLALCLTWTQVWPTWVLARQAGQQRDWEYLSGFAAPPTHWVGLLVPALGRTATFWRPLFWDQFHTSPEELFFYVGLVPLWLACVAIIRKFRTDNLTQSLVITLIGVLFLAAGPYMPGFSLLIRLPGFSFFRAPARWTLAATLILSLLSAQGFDIVLNDSLSAIRSIRRFCIASLLLILTTVLVVESAISLSNSRSGPEATAISIIDFVRARYMPLWDDVRSVQNWVSVSRKFPVPEAGNYAKPYTRLELVNFNRDRWMAYTREIGPQAALLFGFLIGSIFVRNRITLTALLVIVVSVDLLMVSGLRSIEMAPITDVASQSPVLNHLQKLALTHDWPLAVGGDLGNLPMSVDASPIKAYRTLDIPVMPRLNSILAQPFDPKAMQLARLAGLGVIVFDPLSWAQIRGRWVPVNAEVMEVDDPTLWAWLTTSKIAAQGPTKFGIVVLNDPVGRAWHLPIRELGAVDLQNGLSQFVSQLTSMENLETLAQKARPITVSRPVPELINIQIVTQEPELLIISQWAAPDWTAHLTDKTGKSKPVDILKLEGGWQGVVIPDSGEFRLEFHYRPAHWNLILGVTLLSWLTSGFVWLGCGQNRLRAMMKSEPTSSIPSQS